MILQALLMTMLTSQAAPNTQPIVSDTPVMETQTATIEAIDKTTHMVTFKYDDGTTEAILARPDIKRFNELKVGQKVMFRYYESVAYQVRKAGMPGSAPKDHTAVTPGIGKRPGGTMARQHTASVTVVSVDPNRPSITVRTADGHTVTHLVKDKRHLEGVAPGDHVDVTYTEALLAEVEPK